MNLVNISPGSIVASNFGAYEHWSIVSDKKCEKGLPMLISATKRTGTVREEPWELATNGKPTRVIHPHQNLPRPLEEVLSQARSKIGKWTYSLTSHNCEHFAKWAAGLNVTSQQVTGGVVGAIGGTVIAGMLTEKPSMLQLAAGALAGSILGVATARPATQHANSLTSTTELPAAVSDSVCVIAARTFP